MKGHDLFDLDMSLIPSHHIPICLKLNANVDDDEVKYMTDAEAFEMIPTVVVMWILMCVLL